MSQMQAWKQQVDGCLRTIETLVEAATKLRALQLEAAANADARGRHRAGMPVS